MNKQEYIEKINLFYLIIQNLKTGTDTLKKKANIYIKAVTAAQNDIKIKQIVGYIYGNVKIHKQKIVETFLSIKIHNQTYLSI